MAKAKEETPEQAQIAELNKKLAASKEAEKHLEKQLADADGTLEELNAVNNNLMEKIEEMEAAAGAGKPTAITNQIPDKSFKVGKTAYVFTVPQFTNPLDGHSIITAKEALTNKELQEYLVENECGVTKRASA